MTGIRSQADTTGDDSVHAATSRSPQEWFALLDEAGAADWSHTRIAAWLTGDHGVDGWWAQNVTVRYEQARGRRKPGQRADGTYSVSVSVTLHGGLEEIRRSTMPALVGVFGETTAESPTAKRPTARWRTDGTTLLAQFDPIREDAVRLSLTQERIAEEQSVAGIKERLRTVLTSLRPG